MMKLSFTQKIKNDIHPLSQIDDPRTSFSPENTLRELFFSASRSPQQNIIDSDGNPQPEDEALNQLMTSLDTDGIDRNHQDDTRHMLSTLVPHYTDHDLLITDQFFVEQGRVIDNLPEASDDVLYTLMGDIIKPSQDILEEDQTIRSLLYPAYNTLYSRSLTYAFRDDDTFQRFLNKIPDLMDQLDTMIPGKTQDFIDTFRSEVTLDRPAEGLFLRKHNTLGNEPLSTSRVIIWLLNTWVYSQDEYTADILPFSVNELIVPRVVTLMNIEEVAKSSPSTIHKDWNTMNNMFHQASRYVSQNTLRTFSDVEGMAGDAIERARYAQDRRESQLAKQREQPISGNEPTPMQIFQAIDNISRKMGQTGFSHNYVKTRRPSFMRSNRRQPDNPSMPGMVTRKTYRPDIILHIDTSPSVKPENYDQTVKYIIRSAKHHGVNLYIASFADFYVAPVLLTTEGRSLQQINAAFHKIKKAAGCGTDYVPIWEFLNTHPKYQRALNLIITDFGYVPPNDVVTHPKNLYYAPLNGMDWNSVTTWCNEFIRDMKHIDQNIRTKILGM